MVSKISESQHIYINASCTTAFRTFTAELRGQIDRALEKGCKSVVFVCIGTDRSTGDSLGPLVGYKISGTNYKGMHVYGDLENPVHAKNLEEIVTRIPFECDRPFIVAIDACLGSMNHIGYVGIGSGPVRPGSGVNKELPPIGDMFITGIVNFGGFMDFLVLQNTRLHTVMKIADFIAKGIRYVIGELEKEEGSNSIRHFPNISL